MTFILFHLVGGDPALHFAGKNSDPQTVAILKHEFGLDQNLFIQYLHTLKKSCTFDWGRSWATSQPIMSLIGSGIGPTLSLTLPAFILSFLVSLFLALLASYKRGLTDRILLFACLATMSISFVVYIVLFQKWFAFDWGLFPVYGWEHSSPLKYLILPWFIYILSTLGPKILLFRTALLQEIDKDYVRTARAKGVSERVVFYRHILKNSLLPIVTLTFAQLPTVFTGSLLLEAYFGIPGLGGQLITAIHGSDFPVIQAMTILGSWLTILFNLFNDLLCAFVDPRVEFV